MPHRIHPTAVLGPGVKLGSGNVVDPCAVVLGPCRIGDGDVVGRGVEIGDRTTLREYTTAHSGSARATRIGSDSLLMNEVHVSHDGDLGDGAALAACAHAGPRPRVVAEARDRPVSRPAPTTTRGSAGPSAPSGRLGP